MKSEWAIEPLGEICEFQRGLTYGKSDEVGMSNNIVLRANNVDLASNSLNLTDLRYISDTITVAPSKKVRKGSLIICTASGSKSHLGKVAYIDNDYGYAFGGFMGQITPNDRVEGRYLFHVLTSQAYKTFIDGLSDGININNLKFDDLRQFPVALPTVQEQQRIVAILDEAFEAIATAKANAENNLRSAREMYGRLNAAVLDQLVAVSRTMILEDVAERGCSLSYGIVQPGDELASGLPIVRPVDLNDGVVTLDRLKRIDPASAKSYNRTTLKGGDILLCVRGTTGALALADSELVGANVTRGIVPIRFDEAQLSQSFGYCLMRSEAVQFQIRAKTYGTALMQINIRDLRRITLPVPPKNEQEAAVKRFDELKAVTDHLATTYERKLAALEELKESLLHQAFSGQLTSSKQTSISHHPVLQTTTPEFTANVISFAHARHERLKREKTFGRVKEQKTLHLIESIAGIDLGRQPMRDAAGPNDFQHMLRAEEWAKSNGFFEMVKSGAGYEFRKLSRFDEHMSHARHALAPYLSRLEPVIDLLVPLDKEEAEVFATVHAAWNNLLIDGVQATDDAIVMAARQDWHPDKLKIQEHKFRTAIEKIRQKKLIPTGSAKYVGGQKTLFGESELPMQRR